jgi:hypothetical protein
MSVRERNRDGGDGDYWENVGGGGIEVNELMPGCVDEYEKER